MYHKEAVNTSHNIKKSHTTQVGDLHKPQKNGRPERKSEAFVLIESTENEDQKTSFDKKNLNEKQKSYDPIDIEHMQTYFAFQETKNTMPINSTEKYEMLHGFERQREVLRVQIIEHFGLGKYIQALPLCKKLYSLSQTILSTQKKDAKEIYDFIIDSFFNLKCLLKTDNFDFATPEAIKLWTFINNFIKEDFVISDLLKDKFKLQKIKSSKEYLEFLDKYQKYCCINLQKMFFIKKIEDALLDITDNGSGRKLFISIELRRRTSIVSTIATFLYALGEFKTAELAYAKYTKIIETNLGADSTETSNCYFLLGVFYFQHKCFKKSLACYYHALDIRKAKLGLKHEAVADCYFNIGLIYKETGKIEKAVYTLNNMIDIIKEFVGEFSLPVARIYELIAKIHIEHQNYKIGLAKLTEVYFIRKNLLADENHIDMQRVLYLLYDLKKKILNNVELMRDAKNKELMISLKDIFDDINKTFKTNIIPNNMHGSIPEEEEFKIIEPEEIEASNKKNSNENSFSKNRLNESFSHKEEDSFNNKNSLSPDSHLPLKLKETESLQHLPESNRANVLEENDSQNESSLSIQYDNKFLETLDIEQIYKLYEIQDIIHLNIVQNSSYNPLPDILSSAFYKSLSEDQKKSIKNLNKPLFAGMKQCGFMLIELIKFFF